MNPRPFWHPLVFMLVVIGALRILTPFNGYAGMLADDLPLLFGLILVTSVVARLPGREERILRWFKCALGTDAGAETRRTARDSGKPSSAPWLVGGLVFLAAGVCLLEARQPFYFTQDDNFAASLQPVATACRSLDHGVLATWNPCQLLGEPTADQCYYGILYPPTILSWEVSKRLLGNGNLWIDVFCILHLVLGYLACWWAARAVGLRPMLATTAALCTVLSGCNLIMGRSYFHMTPVLVWMPLLVVSLVHIQRRGPSWKWLGATGMVIGFSSYSGNGQMWVYCLMFFVLAAGFLALGGQLSGRRFAWLVPALLLGGGIASPLAIPQMVLADSTTRIGGTGGGIDWAGILCMLLPYPLAHGTHPDRWGSFHLALMGDFYYAGTLFAAVGLTAILAAPAFLTAYRWNRETTRRVIGQNPWLWNAAIALLLALGFQGFLWTGLCTLPVLNMFTGPFKFVLFLNPFLALGGGLILERLMPASPTSTPPHLHTSTRWIKPSAGGTVVACCLALLAYHLTLALPAFYTYAGRPYPPLPQPAARILRGSDSCFPSRIMGFGPTRSPAPDFPLTMVLNFPTAYGLLSPYGYNPLVPLTAPNLLEFQQFQADPLRAARAYGIRWVLVHRLAANPVLGPNAGMHARERFDLRSRRRLDCLLPGCVLRLNTPEMAIWELEGTSPLAFSTENPDVPLPIRFDQQGARVDLGDSRHEGDVVVNILWRPQMVVTTDGRRCKARADDYGRLVAAVPAGAHEIRVRYCPPWGTGFLAGLTLAAVAGVIGCALSGLRGLGA